MPQRLLINPLLPTCGALLERRVSITGSKWLGNKCTDQRRCHTGGLYITEGASVTVTKSSFRSNRVRVSLTGR
jgi:hypothetical protein